MQKDTKRHVSKICHLIEFIAKSVLVQRSYINKTKCPTIHENVTFDFVSNVHQSDTCLPESPGGGIAPSRVIQPGNFSNSTQQLL